MYLKENTMSLESNKFIVRRYIEEVWGRNNQETALELLDPGYIDHNPPPGVRPDRVGLLEAIAIFATAFPGAELSLDGLIAEKDLVADRWTLRGVQKGDFFGIAPTGRRITLSGMDFHRLEDSKITETWHIEDILGLLRQLGVSAR